MFQLTVEHEGVSVTVGRATPLTLLMRSVYRLALIKMYPDLEDWMNKLDKIQDDKERQAEAEQYPEDVQRILTSVSTFIHYASFVVEAKGLPFAWPRPGEMPQQSRVQEMFGAFMSDVTGLWQKVAEAVLEVNQNLAPAEEQAIPPGTEESVDPNSSPLTVTGSGEFDGMPVELFSGERS